MNTQRNIYALLLIKISHWLMLIMPIVVLFYQENGLSMHEVLVLQSVYSISIVALEIPSGYVADVWGRKNTIIIGSIMGTIGFAVYCVSYSFIGFLIAEIILGFGQSFISGADSALLYDSLLESGKEKEYTKLEGKVTSMGNFAEAFAGIIGGALATFSLRTPYYFQVFVAALAIPAAFMLIESKNKSKNLKMKFTDIIGVVKYALVSHKELRWKIILSSVIGCSTLTMAWFVQPFFKIVEIPISSYGILWALLNLSVGLTSLYAYKIENYLGEKRTIFLIAILISLGFISIGYYISVWAISLIFIFYLIRGIATPVLKNYINNITASEVRATVLSVRNFVIRILFAVIGPFIGWINDKYSLSTALIFAGILFFILCLVPLLFVITSYKKKEIN